MPTDPAADRALLLGLRRGEPSALGLLIERWKRPLAGFAFRYVRNAADANDLVAETFVRLYQAREGLREDTRLSAWLFTTLTHLCHNHHRWRRRHPTVELAPEDGAGAAPAEEMLSREPAPGLSITRDEASEAVRCAVDALPHDLKVVVLLHHYENLPYRDIARVVGCSERGVETRLYRARARLREALASFITETSAR